MWALSNTERCAVGSLIRVAACVLVASTIIGLWPSGASAESACAATIQQAETARFAARYDPFEIADTVLARQITIGHTAAQCRYFIGFESSGARGNVRLLTGPRGERLQVFVYGRDLSGATLSDLPEAAEENLLPLLTSASSRQSTVLWHAVLPAGQLSSAGAYTGSITIRLYSANGGSTELLDSRTLPFSAAVAPSVSARIEIAGGRQDLAGSRSRVNLGQLAAGTESRFALVTNANTSFELQFASQNAGMLRRDGAAPATGVPYSLFVNDRPVDLRYGVAAAWLGQGRSQQHVRVVVGSAKYALGGRYRDVVTISVLAR